MMPSRDPVSTPDLAPARRDALIVALLHMGVAAWYAFGRGVTIVHDYGPDPWSWFWQNVPADLLRDHALQSLWYLHAQPPLWNALGALMLELFGGAQLPALQVLHVLIGAATAALCTWLTTSLTAGRRWGAAVGLGVALHPALLLYEAYALYTTLVAFGVVAAACLLHLASERRSSRLAVGFIAAVVALVLTRSLFHPVLFVAVVPLALLAGGRPTRAQLAVLGFLVLLPFGWYGKNLVQYGFFGGSSWYGMGLWRTALFRQEQPELQALYREGALDPVVQIEAFSRPSAYAALGYVGTSDVPLLARDDLHNVNVPAISAGYQRSAVALIRHDPARYLANMLIGYGNFSAPSTDFPHLDPNRARLGLHAEAYRWLTGRPLMAVLEKPFGFYMGSIYFLLVPLTLIGWTVARLRGVRSFGAVADRIRADAAPAFVVLLVGYTVLVGCAMELGENVRFKFLIEPAFLVLVAVMAHRTLRRRAFARRRTAAPLGSPSLRP